MYNKEKASYMRTHNKNVRTTITLRFNYQFHSSLFLLIIICVYHTQFVSAVQPTQQQSSTDRQSTNMSINLCCTWDEQISDGVLKYKVINMDHRQRTDVREAFQSWDKQLTALKLVEVPSSEENAEIVVTFGDIGNGNTNQFVKSKGAGQVAGQSVNNLDQDGYVKNATIILSDEVFKKRSDPKTLFAVVQHEIGHVLGLGHANFNDDLMNPMVTSEIGKVSVCDVNGVIKANEGTLMKKILPSYLPDLEGKKFVNC
jgi:predicted Zn-dependent protease